MDEQTHLRSEGWLETRVELQRKINRVKIMLWAYDFGAAREEIAEIRDRFGELLANSLEVKKHLTSIRRKNKNRIERECREQGLRGARLQRLVRERLAGMLKLKDEVEDDLYLLGPTAVIVDRLEKRVAGQQGQPLLFDEQSGFHYTVGLIGYQQWEIRAYCFEPSPMNPDALVTALQEHLKSGLFLVDEDVGRPGWPLWQRAFLSDVSLDLRFYNPGRFTVSVTGSRETSIDLLRDALFQAVASAQEASSRMHT